MAPYPHVVIRVEDEGHGRDPSVMAHAFEPFFTAKDVGEGTGLGLSVAYGIMKEHGGFMRVTSVEGEGSRFTICLPSAADSGRSADSAPPRTAVGSGPETS